MTVFFAVTVAVSFFFGAVAVLAAQAVALLYYLRRLRGDPLSPRRDDIPRYLDPEQSIAFAWNKQGVIWMLEPDKIPKFGGSPAKPSKDKKDILEVHPEKKYAKIKEHSLTLISSDGSLTKIELVGCTVHAVSASCLSSRKWAKRYPIKIGNQSSNIYNGSKILYIYLETSWDKESWCRSLRLAASKDNQNVNWYRKVTDEFHSYLSLLLSAYPFLKSHIGSKEATDKVDIRMMEGSSKVRVFLKKFAKKASKNTSDNRIGSIVGRDDNKAPGESIAGSHKPATIEKCANKKSDKEIMASTLDAFSVRNQNTAGPDADFDRSGHDEGILSLNLLIARLFFDVRKNNTINSYVQDRIQRTLSNMRTPSYVGAITCINFNLGNLPPYIHGIRVLPMDLNEVWAMELDVEYSGNALLEAETRLEVSEPEFQRGLLNASMESTSTREASSDLLEGLEQYEETATLNTADPKVKRDTGDYSDGLTSTKSSSWASAYTSRWKSMVNLVAGQVSQVPLSLAIKFVSVRGTLRVHIKPPPSDQVWFGFTSMPSIEWNFDSFVGEHKFTAANVLIGNRLKAAIRETLVLPNCEYISLPWMLADRNDWLPRKSAPFLWANHQDGGGHSANSDSGSSSRESGETIKNRKDTCLEGSGRNKDSSSSNHRGEGLLKNFEASAQDIGPVIETGQHLEHSYSSQTTRKSDASIHDCDSELIEPLLVNPRLELYASQRSGYSSDGILSRDQSSDSLVLDDAKPKKTGRRAKMMDLGKKMGEKLEEKRRNLEEKSRIIVERMRENTKITNPS